MYGEEDNNSPAHFQTFDNKNTQHISPHIAAHKSPIGSLASRHSDIIPSSESSYISHVGLDTTHNFSNHHVSEYRVGIPASVYGENFQHNIIKSHSTTPIQVPTIFTITASKPLPQDLSTNTSKVMVSELQAVTNPKHGSLIHPVSGQVLQNVTGPMVLPTSDRSMYYRLADGRTISISNPHQTVLLAPQNVDNGNVHQSHVVTNRQIEAIENESVSASSMGGFIPVQTSNIETITTTHHSNTNEVAEGQLYFIPAIPNNAYISTPDAILPDRDIIRNPICESIKQENGAEKDLVRQAFQAAVIQNSHNSISNNITNNDVDCSYSSDVGVTDECVSQEDICHSTFCSQPNVKPQEILLMNIQLDSRQQNHSKMAGSSVQEGNGGIEGVLDPNASDQGFSGSAFPPVLGCRRRRSKVSEESQVAKKEKVATRMKEKRASESDDQKEKRRLREAERMRRKRAMEDESSKERRRREAAERARLRRAKLSSEERELERKKAATRMRLRRRNENEEQKKIRRIKAAERMRLRRSNETPEERTARKLNLAMRSKVKKNLKEPEETQHVPNDHTLPEQTYKPKEESTDNLLHSNSKASVNVSDSLEGYEPFASQISLPTPLIAATNLTFVPTEPNSNIIPASVISNTLSQISQPMSALQLRSLSASEHIASKNFNNVVSVPVGLHKGVVISPTSPPPAYPERIVGTPAAVEVERGSPPLHTSPPAHFEAHHSFPLKRERIGANVKDPPSSLAETQPSLRLRHQS